MVSRDEAAAQCERAVINALTFRLKTASNGPSAWIGDFHNNIGHKRTCLPVSMVQRKVTCGLCRQANRGLNPAFKAASARDREAATLAGVDFSGSRRYAGCRQEEAVNRCSLLAKVGAGRGTERDLQCLNRKRFVASAA